MNYNEEIWKAYRYALDNIPSGTPEHAAVIAAGPSVFVKGNPTGIQMGQIAAGYASKCSGFWASMYFVTASGVWNGGDADDH